MSANTEHRYAVVVAGGAGTRLWPLSRKALPKQMQALMSDRTLIDETVDRLRGLLPIEHIYISTTENYLEKMRELLPDIPAANFIVEPGAPYSRGTPAAFALLAQRLVAQDPEAVVFTLASDHAITGVERFQETMRVCFDFIDSHPEWLTIVGITPTRPDTGLGYIRASEKAQHDPPVLHVEKYVEKPTHEVAVTYVASGGYYWNSAYYCFRADTLVEAYRHASPALVEATGAYLASGDREDYARAPLAAHEVDIIDAATTPIAVVPSEFTWSDIGNWATLHRTLSELVGSDLVSRSSGDHVDAGSSNYLVINDHARIVGTAGLDHIAVITTADAVLVVDLTKLEETPTLMQDLLAKIQDYDEGRYL